MTARLAEPALDGHAVGLCQTEGFAVVEAVADEQMERLTMRTDFGTGKIELLELIQVFDNGAKLGYNDHVREPGPKEAAKLVSSGRAMPFSRMTPSIRISRRKTKAALIGRLDGWRWDIPPFYSAETGSIATKDFGRGHYGFI